MSTKTPSKIETYLNFGGRGSEALEFYKKHLGAQELMLLRFKDCPDKNMIRPGTEEQIMHCTFKVGETILMLSDGGCEEGVKGFHGFALSISAADEAQAKSLFGALSEGGSVQMPLGQTFFSPCFGMLTDKFGMGWMIIVHPPQQA